MTRSPEPTAGEPAARPRSMWLGALVILVVIAVIFVVVSLLTSSDERTPLPATPPADVTPDPQ